MSIHSLRLIGLLSLGLGLACSGGSSPTDMSEPKDLHPVDLPSADLTNQADLAPPNVFNGCDTPSFMDQMATGASRTVTFGNTGNVYTPKCILIATGQGVTFSGAFTTHPLKAGTLTDANAGSPSSPIAMTSSGTAATFTFNTAGTYPYFCTVHGSFGMSGVVRVQ
jgi:plastocyanin